MTLTSLPPLHYSYFILFLFYLEFFFAFFIHLFILSLPHLLFLTTLLLISPISLCVATSYLSSLPSPLYPSLPPSPSLPFSLLVSSLLFMSTHVLSYRLISCHVSASYEFKIDRGGGEAREYAQTTECNQQRPPQGKSLLHIADVVIALVSILFYNVYIMLYYAILHLSHIIFILCYFRSWKHQCTRETKTKKN